MNREEILKLTTGRKIDELIARHVTMLDGVSWRHRPNFGDWEESKEGIGDIYFHAFQMEKGIYFLHSVPRYSSDISAAWNVVEVMREHIVEIYPGIDFSSKAKVWSIMYWDSFEGCWMITYDESFPLLICRVALLYVLGK